MLTSWERGIVAFLKDTQAFFMEQRLVWAMIIIVSIYVDVLFLDQAVLILLKLKSRFSLYSYSTKKS